METLNNECVCVCMCACMYVCVYVHAYVRAVSIALPIHSEKVFQANTDHQNTIYKMATYLYVHIFYTQGVFV